MGRDSAVSFDMPKIESVGDDAPRAVAIANGTLAAAVGLGLRLWIPRLIIWVIGHAAAVWAAKRDAQFVDVVHGGSLRRGQGAAAGELKPGRTLRLRMRPFRREMGSVF
jgi:hypothetical protein